jgi:hypothetical protein
LLTWTKVCFPSNRRSFGYHTSTYLLMYKSRGRHLVINLSYHTNISFSINSLSYNIMYLSWFNTSHNFPSFIMLVWSYFWWFRYPFVSVLLWEWTYSNPLHISRYYCSYYFRKQSTCSEGGLSPSPSSHPTTSGYFYYQKWFSYFHGPCHCWSDLHKYGAMNINDYNTCSNDGCLGEDMILHQTNIKWWFHSPCY